MVVRWVRVVERFKVTGGQGERDASGPYVEIEKGKKLVAKAIGPAALVTG